MKTPKSHRLLKPGIERRSRVQSDSSSSNVTVANDPTIDFDEQFVMEILKKSWVIYKVSRLFRFSYNERNLKKYSSLLSAYINAEGRKGTAIEVDIGGPVKVTFSVIHVTTKTESRQPGVKISIKSEVKGKTIFTGILCSIKDNEDSLTDQQSTHFTCLPILLTGGPISVTNHVTRFLMQKFDCYISQLAIRRMELDWMLTMWPFSTDNSKPILLLFSTNQTDIKNISVKFNSEPIRAIWESIHDKDSMEITIEEVEKFTMCFSTHFKHVLHIDLDAEGVSLTRIETAILRADVNSKIKIYDKEQVFPVLHYLSSLSELYVSQRNTSM